jgi:hypothetical protein
MSIEKLYMSKTGGELSPSECQKINSQLALMSVSDIPKGQLDNVADYLVSALNMNPVSAKEIEALDSLLSKLQHST